MIGVKKAKLKAFKVKSKICYEGKFINYLKKKHPTAAVIKKCKADDYFQIQMAMGLMCLDEGDIVYYGVKTNEIIVVNIKFDKHFFWYHMQNLSQIYCKKFLPMIIEYLKCKGFM